MNKMLIFLVKEEITKFTEVVKPTAIKTKLSENLAIYLVPSKEKTPCWVNNFFCGTLDTKQISNSFSQVLVVTKVKIPNGASRIFAISFGHGRFLLNNDVCEDRFGLKVVLNSVPFDKLRSISKITVGGSQKMAKEQLPKVSSIADFGYDIERDLMNGVTGVSSEPCFGNKTISGSDSLSVYGDVDINSLNDFLITCYNKYTDSLYLSNFSWIDQIKEIKDKQTKVQLDSLLIDRIKNRSSDVWTAVPEIIDWEDIAYFKYFDNTADDVYIENVFSDEFVNELVSIEQIKSITITAMSLSTDTKLSKWNAYKCLFGEISIGAKSFCINAGKWFEIDNDFVSIVNKEYNQTQISSYFLPDNNNESENIYNQRVALENENIICLDARNISYGGGYSKIEICDLLSNNHDLIYVKPYSGSSTLSHLFNQAMVSGELLIYDNKFRNLAQENISNLTTDLSFNISAEFNPKQYCIIFGIIVNTKSNRPKLPFFSKVAFKYAKKRLEAFGYTVTIKSIYKPKHGATKAA